MRVHCLDKCNIQLVDTEKENGWVMQKSHFEGGKPEKWQPCSMFCFLFFLFQYIFKQTHPFDKRKLFNAVFKILQIEKMH